MFRDRSIDVFVVFADDRVVPAQAPAVRWW
jgi:hypothetical protein